MRVASWWAWNPRPQRTRGLRPGDVITRLPLTQSARGVLDNDGNSIASRVPYLSSRTRLPLTQSARHNLGLVSDVAWTWPRLGTEASSSPPQTLSQPPRTQSRQVAPELSEPATTHHIPSSYSIILVDDSPFARQVPPALSELATRRAALGRPGGAGQRRSGNGAGAGGRYGGGRPYR